MPNTIQHGLWPIIWTYIVATAFLGLSSTIWLVATILALPMAIYSMLPDLLGVWGGSSPGWGFQPEGKGNDWSLYSEAHKGITAIKMGKNPFYAFHLWQDKFSHGDPFYFFSFYLKGRDSWTLGEYDIAQIRKKQSFIWDFINDVLVLLLLVVITGPIRTIFLVCGLCLALYAYKIIVWKVKFPERG